MQILNVWLPYLQSLKFVHHNYEINVPYCEKQVYTERKCTVINEV